MKPLIEAWIKELDTEIHMRERVWGQPDAMKPSQRKRYDMLRELREFLEALLNQPQRAPYDDYIDALRWCIHKLGQGEPSEEKQRVREMLVNLRVHLGVLLADQCMQDLLQKHVDAGRTDLLEVPNANAYDLSWRQMQEAWRMLNPPSSFSTSEPELTLEG